MDLSTVNGTFILLKRFRFPVGNSTKDAIAVTSSNGLTLVSLYTLMINVTISQIWLAFVLVSVAIFMRKNHSHNRAAATAGIYNAASSQTAVMTIVLKYLKPMKGEIWYPISWCIFALIALAGVSAASILIPRLLVIGNAAPVNPLSVYFPSSLLNNTEAEDITITARAFSLTVPFFQRSAGQVAVTPRNSVVVEQERNADPRMVRVNYRYNVSAGEFGLQHAEGLVLYVEGSCHTEYGWHQPNTKPERSNDIQDTYNLWNNETYQVNVSGVYDGGPPVPFFEVNTDIQNPGTGNISYSIIVSSLNRFSFTPSTDPWYLTKSFDDPNVAFKNIISTGRPALSCWEASKFNYRGKSVDIYNLHTLDLAAFASLDKTQTPFLTDILQSTNSVPLICNLGTGLGRSALTSSSSSAVGVGFNAGTASIFQDLEFLVIASYVATKNLFVETTLFSPRGRDGLPDLARSFTSALVVDNSGLPRPGTGDFIIRDRGVITLSVRALIAIPLAMAASVLAVFLLGLLPSPWRVSHALNATVLYSHLHEREERDLGQDLEWDREGSVAFSPQKSQAHITPLYKEKMGQKKGGYFWLSRRETEQSGLPLARE